MFYLEQKGNIVNVYNQIYNPDFIHTPYYHKPYKYDYVIMVEQLPLCYMPFTYYKLLLSKKELYS